MKIWNLKQYIEKKKSPSPYSADFELKIEADQLNESFAIVGDTGILTRNAHSSEYIGFHDFVVNL